MAKQKDYFGLDKVVSLILAIIPVTSLVCGVITRAKEGKWLAVILRIFTGWNIIWIADIIMMATKREILRVL